MHNLKFRIKRFFYKLLGMKLEIQFYANPLLKWPVNRMCFCGSNKKFKICCKNEISRKLDSKDLIMVKNALNRKGIIL